MPNTINCDAGSEQNAFKVNSNTKSYISHKYWTKQTTPYKNQFKESKQAVGINKVTKIMLLTDIFINLQHNVFL